MQDFITTTPTTSYHMATPAQAQFDRRESIGWTDGGVKTAAVGTMAIAPIWYAASTASSIACVWHGYKRNNSVGWALWWGLMGGMFPIVAPVVALAQGFGKPIKATPNKRGKHRRRRSKR